MLPVEQPFKTFTGLDGKPLDNGYVYFGKPNLNPITAPITVYWDAAGTIPAAQPLRTMNGYILRGGTPANVFFDGAYSETVLDSKKRQVFSARTSDEFSISAAITGFLSSIAGGAGGALMGFIAAGAGAIARTVLEKLREQVTVTDYLPKGYVIDGSVDYTTYVQKAVDAMGANSLLVFPTGVNVGVTRIALDGKSDWAIRIDGKITNLAAKPGGAATDANTAARGLAATFYITNCSRFKIFGSGSINNGFREAFCIGEYLPASQAAPCADFEINVDVRGSGANDNMHANRIRYCSRFTFRDMALDSLTKKPPYVNNSTPYYYNWAETLLLWDCTDFEIRGVRARMNGMNGIYVGSNCERFTIAGNDLEHNAGSGIQLAWSSFGSFPRHFTISGNRAAFNRADGWDINNTGPLLDVFGIVTDNLSFYNGWGTEDAAGTTPTNDGSGIGTYINLKKMTVTNNIDHECARTGGYFSLVWDTSVTDNVITKEAAGSQGDGLYFLRCTNIDANSNNVNVLPFRAALIVFGDNADQGNIRINENYFYGQVTYDGGIHTGSFTNNKVICQAQVTMPVDAIRNEITVTGPGQSGLYVASHNMTVEGNKVKAPKFGIIAYGAYSPKVMNNYAVGGDGGLRVDSCVAGKVSGNYGKGVTSPGIHLLGVCDGMELSSNQAESSTGNSFRVESSVTNTHKWANRIVSGGADFGGTYGINF